MNATTEIINAELVAKINEIVEQWNQSDRAIRATEMPLWTKRAASSGLETGAMLQIGKIAPSDVVVALGLDDEGRLETIGEAVFQAYLRGAVVAALDTIN